MYKYIKKIVLVFFVCSTFLVSTQDIVLAAYNPKNPNNMHWKAYGDGTFAWIPEEEPIDNIVKRGAWYQYDDGNWAFYMSTDGGNTFLPLKSCTAYINFNNSPLYNLYTFDQNGIMVGGIFQNLEFPPQDMLYINIYATNLHLKMQPGGICVVDGTVLNGRKQGPSFFR